MGMGEIPAEQIMSNRLQGLWKERLCNWAGGRKKNIHKR